MQQITDLEFSEYQALRREFSTVSLYGSLQQLKSLKDDIDAPLRRTIAGLALLGCEPVWSCCGYNYPGQPIHKRHTYGSLFILVKRNERSRQFFYALPRIGEDPLYQGWQRNTSARDGVWSLSMWFKWDNGQGREWAWKPEDFHYYGELAQIRIKHLEQAITYLSGRYFAKEAVVTDTNKNYHDRYDKWLYPAIGDWRVTPDDFHQ